MRVTPHSVRGLGIALVLTGAATRTAQSQREYSRSGTLHSIITNRGAVEQLAREVYAEVSTVAPGDSVVRYQVMASSYATDTRGRTVSFQGKSLALDSIAREIDRRSELWRFSAGVTDARLYQTDTGVVPAQRVHQADVSFASDLGSTTRTGGFFFYVTGKDRARVDSIADRIEAFGRTWSTWRSVEMGEMIRTSLKVIGLLLIPLALGLRDRRFSWVLYPTSLVVFAASYLIPFSTLFVDCRILGSG